MKEQKIAKQKTKKFQLWHTATFIVLWTTNKTAFRIHFIDQEIT